MNHTHLSLFGGMYAYKSINPDDTLFSDKLIDTAFKIYEDLFPLQQWVYEMSLTIEMD